MKKTKTRAFGKNVYLLGADRDGIYHWLESSTWDCDWYWSGGYVETYTIDQHPERARDIKSHQHFDSLFFNSKKNSFDSFKEYFPETPFSDSEIWKILELLKSFYIARSYSDMLHQGGAHYTTNPAKNVISNELEYNRINKKVIPEILKNLYLILGDDM